MVILQLTNIYFAYLPPVSLVVVSSKFPYLQLLLVIWLFYSSQWPNGEWKILKIQQCDSAVTLWNNCEHEEMTNLLAVTEWCLEIKNIWKMMSFTGFASIVIYLVCLFWHLLSIVLPWLLPCLSLPLMLEWPRINCTTLALWHSTKLVCG